MSVCTRENLVSTIALPIFLLNNLGFADLALAVIPLDCETANSSFVVITSEGVEPASRYCDFQEKLPQVATNDIVEYQPVTTTIRKQILKFGKLYRSQGNVCRDRGIDTICLSPNKADILNELE